MNFEIVPAHELSLAEQAGIFNLAFAGYLAGWSKMDAAALARFLCAQGADLCYSRFVRISGTIVGFGYINRREISRDWLEWELSRRLDGPAPPRICFRSCSKKRKRAETPP